MQTRKGTQHLYCLQSQQLKGGWWEFEKRWSSGSTLATQPNWPQLFLASGLLFPFLQGCAHTNSSISRLQNPRSMTAFLHPFKFNLAWFCTEMFTASESHNLISSPKGYLATLSAFFPEIYLGRPRASQSECWFLFTYSFLNFLFPLHFTISSKEKPGPTFHALEISLAKYPSHCLQVLFSFQQQNIIQLSALYTEDGLSSRVQHPRLFISVWDLREAPFTFIFLTRFYS